MQDLEAVIRGIGLSLCMWSILCSGCGSREPTRVDGRANSPTQSEGSPTAAKDTTVEPGNLARKVSESRPDWANESSCAECHSEISERYAASPMARSWRTLPHSDAVNSDVASQSAIATHLNEGVVAEPQSGFQYKITIDKTGVSVAETTLDQSLGFEHELVQTAAYLVGSGNHASALVSQQRNSLFMLPVAWFHHESRWRMSPGYEAQNMRFSRVVAEQCIACHATYAQLVKPTHNQYEGPIIDGIGCQRCHGPAGKHVQFWQGHTRHDGQDPEEAQSKLVNPRDLTPGLANDICLQCHLSSTVSIHLPGKGPFTFRPGDRLADHRLDFLHDTSDPNSFGVASHGTRMMKSRCYTATDGSLTCTACHDAHGSVGETRRESYVTACLQCHQSGDCKAFAQQPDGPESKDCIECHMPRRSTREGQHLVFTDHWIRTPSKPFEPTPAVIPADIQKPLIPVWPDADPLQTKRASAGIWLHETLGPQRSLLGHAIETLEQVRRSGKADQEDLYWLASGFMASERPAQAVTVFDELLANDPANGRARWKQGIALTRARRLDEAMDAFRRCVSDASHWTEPYEQLAFLYLERQEYPGAIMLLRRQLKEQESISAMMNLSAALSQVNSTDREADLWLDRARQLAPLSAVVYLNRGALAATRKDYSQAVKEYQQALKLQPDNPTAIQALQQIMRLSTSPDP